MPSVSLVSFCFPSLDEHRKPEASCWEISSHNRLNTREVINNVFIILRKTRKWRDKWSIRSSRAFVRRTSTHVDALGPNRQSLDPVTETTRFPLRIIDALCA